MNDRMLSASEQNTANIQKSAFSVAVFILILFCIGNFVLGLGWVNKSFPGFFFYENLVITDISPIAVNGNTIKRFKDRILKITGVDVSTPAEIFSITDSLPVGAEVEYTIVRNGNTFNVTIPTQKFSTKDLLLVFGIIYIIGVIFLLIGTMVLHVKPHLRASKAFFFFCASICVWFVGSFNGQAVYFFDQITFFALVFSPFFGICLMFIFPSDTKMRGVTRNLIVLLFLFISAILFILQFIFFDTYEIWKYT